MQGGRGGGEGEGARVISSKNQYPGVRRLCAHPLVVGGEGRGDM